MLIWIIHVFLRELLVYQSYFMIDVVDKNTYMSWEYPIRISSGWYALQRLTVSVNVYCPDISSQSSFSTYCPTGCSLNDKK